MKKDKKEKSFWGVKESEIDEKLLKKILLYQKISLITTLILLPCLVINLLVQLLHKYISDTVQIVFSSIVIAAGVAVIVLYVIYLVNMLKLKKQVLQTQKQTENKKDEQD